MQHIPPTVEDSKTPQMRNYNLPCPCPSPCPCRASYPVSGLDRVPRSMYVCIRIREPGRVRVHILQPLPVALQ